MGALLPFPAILRPDVPLLLPGSGCPSADGTVSELELVSSADVKDQFIGVLLKSGKKEPAGLARCISLSSLGTFVYAELAHGSFHPKIKEAVQVLLTALRFNNKAVAQIASDMLLLADHVDKLLHYYPEVPRKIVEVLARTLLALAPAAAASKNGAMATDEEDTSSPSDDEKRLLLSLLLCLGEWVMRMPRYILTQPQEDGRSLLQHVFSALQGSSEPGALTPSPVGPPDTQRDLRRDGRHFDGFPASSRQVYSDVARTAMSPAGAVADFDPNIHVDDTKEGSYNSNSAANSANNSPMKLAQQQQHHHHHPRTPSAEVPPAFGENTRSMHLQVASSALQHQQKYDEDLSNSPIRLAARTLLSHLINHLFHFPLPGAAGAASLSSMVSEHDDLDLPGNAGGSEDMPAEVFSAPNVQFFLVNSSTLLSFVELPSLDVPGGGLHLSGLRSARSQVRVILRDVSGKFSWDCSALDGTEEGGGDLSADSGVLRERLFPEGALRKRLSGGGFGLKSSNNSPTENQESSGKKAPPSSSGNKVVISLSGGHSAIPTRQRSRGVLPLHEDAVSSEQYDNLDDLLRYLTHTSPECLDAAGRPLNSVAASSSSTGGGGDSGGGGGEGETVAAVLGQRNHEQDQVQRRACEATSRAAAELPPNPAADAVSYEENNLDSLEEDLDPSAQSAFQHCRRLFEQLGLSSWDRRPSVHLVRKNDRLLREVRNLDAKRCREAHKIAVIYVAEGQEDKQSILGNSSGSQVRGISFNFLLHFFNQYSCLFCQISGI